MLKNKFLKFFDFRKGMIRDLSATRLNENQMQTIKNCRIDKDGIISSRYGHSKQYATQIDANGNGNLIAQLKESSYPARLLCNFANTFYHYISSIWSSVKTGFTNAIWNNIQFGDKLILGNGIDNMQSYGQEDMVITGATVTRLISVGTERTSIGDFVEKMNFSDLAQLSIVSGQGSGSNQFDTPYDVYCDATHIYIADTGNNRIVKRLLSDLSFVGSYYVLYPTAIAGDATNLYIASRTAPNTGILYKITKDFAPVTAANMAAGYEPIRLCVDSSSNVYLLAISNSFANNGVYKYNSSLVLQTSLIGIGAGNNQFSLTVFSGICTDNTNLYICDTNNQKLKSHLCSDLSYVGSAVITGGYPLSCFLYSTYLYATLHSTNAPNVSSSLRKYTTIFALDSTIGTLTKSVYGFNIFSQTGSSTEKQYMARDIATPGSFLCASDVSGSCDGAYSYKATWKIGSLESSAGIISNSITVSKKKILLSGYEQPTWLSAIPGALIQFYRTAASGSTYLSLASVAASGSTTYLDNIADYSLGTTSPPVANGIAPKGKFFAEYENHIFTAGDPSYKSFLFISALYSDDDWYDATAGTLRFIRIYENDGDDIMGLKECHGSLYIFKRNSIHRLTGVYPSYNIERLTHSRGTVSHRTICEYKRKLLFLSESGVEMLDGYEPVTLSDNRVKSIVDIINKEYENLSFAYIYKDKYYLWLPTGINTYCDTCIIYDLILDCFIIDTGIQSISGGVFDDIDDYEIPYVADNNGFIWQMENEYFRNDGGDSGTVNGTSAYCTAVSLSGSAVSGVTFSTTGSGLKGVQVYISSGTGIGQSRIITSNTAQVLTVPTWSTIPDANSVYTIGAIDSQLISGKVNAQEDLEHGFREFQSEDTGSGTLNYSVRVEGRTAETFSKTLTSDYLNNRFTPAAQWGKWFQATITQRKANDYFSHRSHTLWMKARGPYKEA